MDCVKLRESLKQSKMKILLNNSYGCFGFSEEFLMELFRRYPGDPVLWGDGLDHCPCWTPELAEEQLIPFCEGYTQEMNGLVFRNEKTKKWYQADNETIGHLRTEPRILALFEEWSSRGLPCNDSFASIHIHEIPEGKQWYIEDNHTGMEWITLQ
jgi:hypothetical protein